MSSNEEIRTYPPVGTLIREGRLRKRLTYRELGTETGLDFSYIHNVESGKRGVSPEVLDNLSRVLEIDRDELYVAAGLWPPSIPPSPEALRTLKTRYSPSLKESEMVEVLATLYTGEDGTPRGRRTAYLHLLEQTSQRRERLITWLKNSGVWNEVKEIGGPNAFGTISITCSPDIIQLLKNAPGVEAIVPADIRTELIE